MSELKLFFCDLETTGLIPHKNSIIEIGAVIQIGDYREEFQTYVKPFPQDLMNQQALSVNKMKMADLKGFPESEDAYNRLIRLLSKYVNKYDKQDKFHFLAYNAIAFDYPFLRKFFEKNGDEYFGSFFFYPPLDVMEMAAFHLRDVRHNMVNFKLTTVARELRLEVDESKAHGALYDIVLTEMMYNKLQGEEL